MLSEYNSVSSSPLLSKNNKRYSMCKDKCVCFKTRNKPQTSSCCVWQRELVFDQISIASQCVFRNIKMKSYVAMIAHNLKALYSESAPKFPRNSEKFEKLQWERPWWSVFLMKFQVCSTFIRIKLYHLYFLDFISHVFPSGNMPQKSS